MPPPLLVLAAGASGLWRIGAMNAVTGPGLPAARHLSVLEGSAITPPEAASWVLRGTTSNTRYTIRAELDILASRQQGLPRADATHAALLPIRKTEAWWALAQDERRGILEEQSRHIAIGLDYLPTVARRLHHARELGEPFDFLTWFEFAPKYREAFDELLDRLRATEEWRYVDREIDIRLTRDPFPARPNRWTARQPNAPAAMA